MRKGYILRLYPYFDIDLLVMAQDPTTKFSHICKEALKAYVRGHEYSIERITPDVDCGRGLIAEKRRLDVCIKFDIYKDKDILEFLDTVKTGYKNIFIKNLIRSYMGGIDLNIFVKNQKQYKVLLDDKFSQGYEMIDSSERNETSEPGNTSVVIKHEHKELTYDEMPEKIIDVVSKKDEQKIPGNDIHTVQNIQSVPEEINSVREVKDSVLDEFLSNTSLY